MIKNDKGEAMNRNGRFIPISSIDKHLIARDRLVTKLIKRAQRLETRIQNEKQYIKTEVEKFLNRYTDNKTVEGNVQLSDYANLNLVIFRSNDIIRFDERLNSAKSYIDKCLKKWSSSANGNLRAIVTEAFNVDKKGRVNTFMILRLTKINIPDADWKKAIQLIQDSINIAGTRSYLSFQRRNSAEEEFQPVKLNFKDV